MTVRKQFHTSEGVVERNLTAGETDPHLLAEYQRNKDISDNLPSWMGISNAIDNAPDLTALKALIKKLARVVYWLAKNSRN